LTKQNEIEELRVLKTQKDEIQIEAETITPVRREKQNSVLIIDGKEVSLPLFDSRHGTFLEYTQNAWMNGREERSISSLALRARPGASMQGKSTNGNFQS
jgi:hypothetical protein